VGVPGVDALHEDVEAPEDHRRRVALDHLLVGEVDLRVDPERPDDAGDRVPGHLLDHDLLFAGTLNGCHVFLLPRATSAWSSRWSIPGGCDATRAPCPAA
jgi:hypothetical protein